MDHRMNNIAFVFAGQGAQYAGMGKALYETSPAAKELLDSFESIRPGTLKQCFEPEGEEQNVTVNTQPCLFAIDCACAVAAEEAGIVAGHAAGFSLGEVAAAAFVGVMDYQQAFQLVIKRAELMQACAQAHPGAMFAVLRLSAAEVEALIDGMADVYPVNYNAPGQTVVACAADQADAFVARAQEQKVKVMRLNVSGGFHSPFMKNASEGLREILGNEVFGLQHVSLYANLTGKPYGDDIADTLARQISSPVLWQQSVENMIAEGVDTFIEVGAGKTLTGLIRRIDKSVTAMNVEDADTLSIAVAALKGGVGE